MIHQDARHDKIEAAMRLFIWPGDRFCDFLDIRDPDSRLLLRMFVNLTVYGKVALSIVFVGSALT